MTIFALLSSFTAFSLLNSHLGYDKVTINQFIGELMRNRIRIQDKKLAILPDWFYENFSSIFPYLR